MNKISLKLKIASILFLYLLFILFVTNYFSENRYVFTNLLNYSVFSLGYLIITVSLGILCRGIINYFFYRLFDINISIKEGTFLAIINTLANQFPFSAGLFAKGAYLKQKHQLPFSLYIPATLALFVCFIAVNGIVGLAGIAWIAALHTRPINLGIIIGFLLMTLSFFILFIPLKVQSISIIAEQKLKQVQKGWQILAHNKKVIYQVSGLQGIGICLFALRYYIIFQLLSVHAGYAYCLLFACTAYLSLLINILPGGIAVREVLVASISAILGFDFGISAIVVGIDRILDLIVTGIWGGLYLLQNRFYPTN